jgi:hypothetical protein
VAADRFWFAVRPRRVPHPHQPQRLHTVVTATTGGRRGKVIQGGGCIARFDFRFGQQRTFDGGEHDVAQVSARGAIASSKFAWFVVREFDDNAPRQFPARRGIRHTGTVQQIFESGEGRTGVGPFQRAASKRVL